MDDPLIDIFETEGRHSSISGNSPILLAGEGHVWCILSGSVEVFAVTLEGDKLSGPKEHFFSAEKGDLLFGMDLDGGGMGQGFQAVGYPGTRVACLPLDRLKALAAEETYQEKLARRIDGWTRGLARA